MIPGAVGRRVALSEKLVDWMPVALLPPVLVIDAVLSSAGHPLTVADVLSAFAACLPLVGRRRLALVVMVPLLVGGVTLVMWQLHPANTVVLIPMVALYELARRGDRRRSLWMSLVTVPSVVAGVVPFAVGANHIAALVGRNLILCLLAIAAGDVLRSRVESTRREVDAREQETLRRVADERLQIAREIHDVVAHAMTAINVQAGVAAHLLQRDPGQAHGALRDIKRTSGDALAELRCTLDVLRDPDQAPSAPIRPPAGLGDLEALTAGLRAAGVGVELDVALSDEVPATVHGAGYRIVQEALTNVARHADATHARVSVRREGDAVTIEVADDGAGCGEMTPGNGLRGMRERALAVGGSLEAARGEGGGWLVQARLPVASAARDSVAGRP